MLAIIDGIAGYVRARERPHSVLGRATAVEAYDAGPEESDLINKLDIP